MFTVCRRFSIVSLGWLVLVFADAVVAAIADDVAAGRIEFEVGLLDSVTLLTPDDAELTEAEATTFII